MTQVEKELLYIPGKTQVKEVCATLNQAHNLQIGTQLLEADDGYCYISDGAESLQTEYLAQLLSRRDADGNPKAMTALDLAMLRSRAKRRRQRPRRSRSRCARRRRFSAMSALTRPWSRASTSTSPRHRR
eukprot:4312344-Pleurochrysis_carterae.AAC.1